MGIGAYNYVLCITTSFPLSLWLEFVVRTRGEKDHELYGVNSVRRKRRCISESN